jgi:hypothetical protein
MEPNRVAVLAGAVAATTSFSSAARLSAGAVLGVVVTARIALNPAAAR